VNWGYPTNLGATAHGTAGFVESLKTSCTGGSARWVTSGDGTRALRMFLGGTRPGAQ
jgi:hypothetical protein